MDILQLKEHYESEKNKLNLLCDKWQKVLDSNARKISNDDTKGAILSVLGQTRLLVTKKLKQFEELLAESESGDTARDKPLITLADLEGFWELVMIQVNEMHTKFENLEKLSFLRNEPNSNFAQRKAKSTSVYKRC